MMACDTMTRPVRETYEVADKISKAEKALDDHANGSLPMSDQAAELLEKQVVAMKTCHDTVAARISHQVEEAAYGAGF